MDVAQSWTWDPVPGYQPDLHRVTPYDLTCAPLCRAVTVDRGRILQDQTTAFLVGRNREVLQSHSLWLQGVVDAAAASVAGFHRDFAIEAHKIPDFPQIPPPESTMFESPAWPATITLAPLTKSGKLAKFPLTVALLVFSDVLVRPDGFFVRVMQQRHVPGDEVVARIGYLASGVVGKASIHCWRKSTRWSVECVTKDGQIVIARIERGDPAGNVTRFYDYNAG